MPGRLWFRLLIGTCLVLAVTLGAVILLVSRALTGSFQDYVEDQQSARVQRAESILSRYYDRQREWTGVSGLVQSVADLMGERLVLADAQGKIVADSAGQLMGQTANEDWRGRRVSLRSQEFAVGTLYISPARVDQSSLDPRASLFLSSFAGYLVWALLVGLLAAIVLSVGMARLLASPLEALTRAVRRLERGDAVQRIDTSVGGEVGDAGGRVQLAGGVAGEGRAASAEHGLGHRARAADAADQHPGVPGGDPGRRSSSRTTRRWRRSTTRCSSSRA